MLRPLFLQLVQVVIVSLGAADVFRRQLAKGRIMGSVGLGNGVGLIGYREHWVLGGVGAACQ